ncbi:hypothetical protein GGR56DRAFT_619571 [Xylariaceae sp. FL0804]|nr:hypothetical protein GGR56DRAFT_619571 [Xylariaceae sp. FL0804]
MPLLPVALYGLMVPPGTVLTPGIREDSVPNAPYRITMAALDPTAPPEADEDGNIPSVPRSTLKVVRKPMSLDDESDEDYLDQLMGGDSDSDDESDEDDEANGGPSDPAKSKKAKKEAALKKLLEAAQEEEDSDEDMNDAKPNGVKASKKGKEPATPSDEDDDESLDSAEDMGLEQLVICTLDTERNYQQALDMTIGPDEDVYFFVEGTHRVFLTGNYIIDTDEMEDDEDDEDDDEDAYDLAETMDGLEDESDDSEVDELDDIQDPRITEVDSDEEEAPKLAAAADSKKGKNKRPAEAEVESLDEMIAKADSGETKLSKKQLKKLKNNKGEPVVQEKTTVEATKDTPSKTDKKVQFAKNLEQGPTGSTAAGKGATLGVKTIQGVTVDDRKIGSGRQVKKGNKVEVRYIGKLADGKVFDSNKKGPPFRFTAGKGDVIKGWDIGIQGMMIGGERRITIPPHLAYGSKALPGIPANSQLVFDVKLVNIK